MSYTYSPLNDTSKEIRLLTVLKEANEAADAQPLRCTLDHYQLEDVNTQNMQATSGISDTRSWPEVCRKLDTNALYREEAWLERTLMTELPKWQPPSCTGPQDDRLPARRFGWGDYVALSYVWGDGTSKRLIQVNGVAFEVGENLYHALIELRNCTRIQQGFKIWADAICINQADRDERSQQVALMSQIYSSAWQIVIWLGPAQDNSHLAMLAVHFMAARMQLEDPVKDYHGSNDTFYWRLPFTRGGTVTTERGHPWKPEAFAALYHLIMRPYWRRLWILQEVVMARDDAPVICGDTCLPWRTFYDAARFFILDGTRLVRLTEQGIGRNHGQTADHVLTRDRDPDERRGAPERTWGLLVQLTLLQQRQRGHTAPNTPPKREIMEPLLLSLEAEAKLEQDRVYGILAIRSVAECTLTKPQYDLPVTEIYESFSQELLTAGVFELLRLTPCTPGSIISKRTIPGLGYIIISPKHGLEKIATCLLRLKHVPAAPPCTHKLASWVTCWTCSRLPVVQLPGVYRAGGSSFSKPRFTTLPRTMILRGLFIDTITSLSAFHISESGARYPHNCQSSRDIRSAYGDISATRNALWRTLCADTSKGGAAEAPQDASWLLDPSIWRYGVRGVVMYEFGPACFMSRNAGLVMCGFTLSELIFGGTSWWKVYNTVRKPDRKQLETLSWMVNAMAWRRIASTEKGRMGLCTAGARMGDRVVVLQGCDMPMLVRPKGDGWVLVGECYLHGVMAGECLVEPDGETRGLNDIKLY